MEPCQDVSLYPNGGLADAPRVKIKGRSDPEHDHSLQSGTMHGHPGFVLRSTDSDKHYVRCGPLDFSHHLGVLLGGQRPEWWCKHVRNLQIGKACQQLLTQHLERIRARSVQKYTVLQPRCLLAQGKHER